MNEFIFLFHVVCVVGMLLIAAWMGKETLIAYICIQGILSNLFLSKQITLIGFNTVSSDVFAVAGLLGMNLLQEFYGKKATQKAITTSAFILCVYVVMSCFQLWYSPNSFDQAHSAFVLILGIMPRVTIASLSVYIIVQLFDTRLYQLLKLWSNGSYLMARNICSLVCSQLIDTILFSFLGLYGTVHSVTEIIVVSFVIKIITIFCMTPFTSLATMLLKDRHD